MKATLSGTQGFVYDPASPMPTRSAVLTVLTLTLTPLSAFAFGSEIPDTGSVAFGRAGAFVARASDPSAIAHNVAGIVGLSGVQLNVSLNVGNFDHCYQRSGNYDENGMVMVDTTGTIFERSGYNNGSTAYPRVCNRPNVGIVPQVMATWRPSRRWAFGFGLYTPSTTGSRQEFLETEQSVNGLAPSPARNMLFRKALVVIHAMVAASWQPTPWLRVGFGLAPSFGSFAFGLVANGARSQAQSPSTDVLIDLSASGVFLSSNLGVQVLPTPYLSFGAQVHYNAPIVASGRGDGTSNLYAPNVGSRVLSNFSVDRMEVQLPWNLRAGARFALPRPGRPHQNESGGDRTYDPMTDDVFDLEAVFSYEATSILGAVNLFNTGNLNVGGTLVPAPATISINSDLRNTMGLRLGGDFNIIPGVLSLRAGAAYETTAVSNKLAQIHLPAYGGLSVNAGLSWRWRWLTTTVGYGHVFFQDNLADQGQRAIVVPSPQLDTQACATNGSGPQACTINRGLYQSHFNVVTLGFAMRF